MERVREALCGRLFYGRRLPEDGHDYRTIQELMGPKERNTTFDRFRYINFHGQLVTGSDACLIQERYKIPTGILLLPYMTEMTGYRSKMDQGT